MTKLALHFLEELGNLVLELFLIVLVLFNQGTKLLAELLLQSGWGVRELLEDFREGFLDTLLQRFGLGRQLLSFGFESLLCLPFAEFTLPLFEKLLHTALELFLVTFVLFDQGTKLLAKLLLQSSRSFRELLEDFGDDLLDALLQSLGLGRQLLSGGFQGLLCLPLEQLLLELLGKLLHMTLELFLVVLVLFDQGTKLLAELLLQSGRSFRELLEDFGNSSGNLLFESLCLFSNRRLDRLGRLLDLAEGSLQLGLQDFRIFSKLANKFGNSLSQFLLLSFSGGRELFEELLVLLGSELDLLHQLFNGFLGTFFIISKFLEDFVDTLGKLSLCSSRDTLQFLQGFLERLLDLLFLLYQFGNGFLEGLFVVSKLLLQGSNL